MKLAPYAQLTLETAPTALPVTVAQMKTLMNIPSGQTDWDTRIEEMIGVAVSVLDAKGALGHAIMLQTWAQWVPDLQDDEVLLEMTPFRALTGVSYYDTDGVLQSATVSNYEAIGTPQRTYIKPKSGYAWPDADSERPDAIKLTYTAGYASASAVPKSIWHLVRIITQRLHDHPELLVERGMNGLTDGLESLINQTRVGFYG